MWQSGDERQRHALPAGCRVLASLAALAADTRRALPSPSHQRPGRHACAGVASRPEAAFTPTAANVALLGDLVPDSPFPVLCDL